MKKSYDIFCKVVDNFGDIGVCWRLAKQLSEERGLAVRLYIDRLDVAAKIVPNLNIVLEQQKVAGVTIFAWHPNTSFDTFPEVVIEAFACGLSEQYLAEMPSTILWVNLEYLSAESWVASFHGRSSATAERRRYFFFPGFSPQTGGLLREAHWNQKNLTDSQCQKIGLQEADGLRISLFAYPHAPFQILLSVLANNPKKSTCYVTAQSIYPALKTYFKVPQIKVGDVLKTGNLQVRILPFLSQPDYDLLLRACDINFVRGEDSWVRAVWAGKPFIWQPYQQEDAAHIPKLNAFLASFFGTLNPLSVLLLTQMHHAWVEDAGILTERYFASLWHQYLAHFGSIKAHCKAQAKVLSQQPDLASKLIDFCNAI